MAGPGSKAMRILGSYKRERALKRIWFLGNGIAAFVYTEWTMRGGGGYRFPTLHSPPTSRGVSIAACRSRRAGPFTRSGALAGGIRGAVPCCEWRSNQPCGNGRIVPHWSARSTKRSCWRALANHVYLLEAVASPTRRYEHGATRLNRSPVVLKRIHCQNYAIREPVADGIAPELQVF